MPVVNLAATGLIVPDQWILAGSYGYLDAINLDDGGTGYYYNEDWYEFSKLLFSYQDLPGDAVGVNSLTQYATLGRSASGGVSSWNWTHRYSSVDYFVGSAAFPPSWTSYNAAITFGGGSGWTVEKVNNSLFGIRYQEAIDHDGRRYYISYHMVNVDYIASGMFVITFIIPFLGIISTSFDRLMRQLLPQVRYTREELERIRQDIKNSQRGYSFPLRAR